MHSYPADALFLSSTDAPVGAPSLTDSQIIQLYNWWLGRPPDSVELASERENALKYSAAGIERQIANRAGNVSGSGVRGDEGAPSLTIVRPAPIVSTQVGSIVSTGVSAIAPGAAPQTGPLGLMTPSYLPGSYAYPSAQQNYSASVLGGFSFTTIAIAAVVAGAAWFLFLRKG
jgi:hypothetical protein